MKREKNKIIFDDLNNTAVIGNVLRNLHHIVDKYEYKNIILDFSQCNAVFPNVAAPLAGIIEYCTVNRNIVFEFEGQTDFLNRTHLLTPNFFDPTISHQFSLNTVWKFATTYEINSLVSTIVQDLEGKTTFEKGILPGIEWCLNEVMDNVIQHSDPNAEHPVGYMMAQVHSENNHVVFCVCDYGQGIQNSLQSLSSPPQNSVDAISRAIQEGVTRNKELHQGNGLWGLHNILRLNSGRLRIISGEGVWFFDGRNVKQNRNQTYLSRNRKGTIIDFQVDVKKTFSIAEALNGHSPVNLRLEALEDNQGNHLVFPLKKEASGTGTRQSGEILRNRILNAAKETPQRIVIDFEDIQVISSSFADELIGKLVSELGFIDFTQRIQLKNMNDIIIPIVNRSVAQRMGAVFG